jgi:hypothetical protein
MKRKALIDLPAIGGRRSAGAAFVTPARERRLPRGCGEGATGGCEVTWRFPAHSVSCHPLLGTHHFQGGLSE